MRLAGNAGPKKSPSGHHRTTLSRYILATNAMSPSYVLTILWTSAH